MVVVKAVVAHMFPTTQPPCYSFWMAPLPGTTPLAYAAEGGNCIYANNTVLQGSRREYLSGGARNSIKF